jgi:hypothetical protein
VNGYAEAAERGFLAGRDARLDVPVGGAPCEPARIEHFNDGRN